MCVKKSVVYLTSDASLSFAQSALETISVFQPFYIVFFNYLILKHKKIILIFVNMCSYMQFRNLCLREKSDNQGLEFIALKIIKINA